MNANLVITTLGTCRVADPILSASRHRPFKRGNKNVYGFAHSSKEVLQQIKTLPTGTLPSEMEPFLADRVGDTKGDIAGPTSVYLVEISTQKEIRFRDWFLQVNYLERTMKAYPKVFSIFKKLQKLEQISARKKLLELEPEFQGLPDMCKAVMLEAFVHTTSKDELEQDMVLMQRLLGAPVLFVSHIDVDATSGHQLLARRRVCQWMREICANSGFELVDPTPLVLEYGRDLALAQAGADVNHYTLDFKKYYGCLLFDDYIPKVLNRDHENQHQNRAWSRVKISDVLHLSQSPKESSSLKREILSSQAVTSENDQIDAVKTNTDTLFVEQVAGSTQASTDRSDLPSEVFRQSEGNDVDQIPQIKNLLKASRYEDALSVVGAMSSEKANSAEVLWLQSKVLMKMERFDEAVRTLQPLRSSDAYRISALHEIARLSNKTKDYVAALEASEQALDLCPGDPISQSHRAEAYYRTKRFDELAKVFPDVLVSAPDSAVKWVSALVDRGYITVVEEGLQAARRRSLKPEIPFTVRDRIVDYLCVKAQRLEESGNDSEAASVWSHVKEIDATNKRALLGLKRICAPSLIKARAATQEGDFGLSESYFKRALELDPSNFRMKYEFTSLIDRQQKWHEALPLWIELSTSADATDQIYLRGARCSLRILNHAQALRFYSLLSLEERQLQTEKMTKCLRRVIMEMRQAFKDGDYDGAMQRAESILLINPEEETSLKIRKRVLSAYIGELRGLRNEPDRTIEICSRIISIVPAHSEAWRVLVELRPSMKNAARAARLLGKPPHPPAASQA